jgi:hypothetical protein
MVTLANFETELAQWLDIEKGKVDIEMNSTEACTSASYIENGRSRRMQDNLRL